MSDKTQTNNITFLFRNIRSGFSIHNVFMPIVHALNASYGEAPCERVGFVSILRNLLWVRKTANQKGINHMTGGPHYFLLAIPLRKNVLTIHDLVLLHNSKGVKNWIFKWFWFKLPFRYAKIVTCITDTVRQEVLSTFNIDPKKVITIYNPVSPIYQHQPLHFNKDFPRILHIGTAWNKNTERVINALKDITCKLIIIGEPTASILSTLKATGIDHLFLCNLSNEELYQQYQLADIISFPSIFEGFGMPIIEGQATGRPILTSNIPPMTEVAGNSACLVNPYETNSIKEGFQKIINDSVYREGLITKGIENVKRFSIKHIVAQYEQLYQEIYENHI